jgi:hypothetical protein
MRVGLIADIHGNLVAESGMPHAELLAQGWR